MAHKLDVNSVFIVLCRVGSIIGHCKIDHKETGYGFSDPYYVHETLKDLVLNYRDHTLADHNATLNTTLAYPVYGPQPTESYQMI